MSTLSITKDYSDTNTLTEAMLDAFASSVETFFNVTKLTADNINNLAVEAENLADNSITTAKIAATAVTNAKLGILGQQLSVNTDNTTTSSSFGVNLPSINITTTGRPVFITFIYGGEDTPFIGATSSSSLAQITLVLKRDGSAIQRTDIRRSASTPTATSIGIPQSGVSFIDVPAAGTYSYNVLATPEGSGISTIFITKCKMMAFEL